MKNIKEFIEDFNLKILNDIEYIREKTIAGC